MSDGLKILLGALGGAIVALLLVGANPLMFILATWLVLRTSVTTSTASSMRSGSLIPERAARPSLPVASCWRTRALSSSSAVRSTGLCSSPAP